MTGPGTPPQPRDRRSGGRASLYRGVWGVLARWLRVPPGPPSLPAGPGEEVRSFRPAPGFLRYLRLRLWLVLALTALAVLVAGGVLLAVAPWPGLLLVALVLIPVGAAFAVAVSAARFRYDATWYVLSRGSVRLRRGIWSMEETTVTFENVQNVKVRQGPLQRLCGVSDVLLETAGAAQASGRSDGNGPSRAAIEGIADPERVRDLVLARVRRSRSAGLGDEPDAGPGARGTRPLPPSSVGWSPQHLQALREIRGEVARLLGRGAGTEDGA